MARTRIIRARVSEEEYEAIRRQAAKRDRDISNFLRHLLRPVLEADTIEQNARRSA